MARLNVVLCMSMLIAVAYCQSNNYASTAATAGTTASGGNGGTTASGGNGGATTTPSSSGGLFADYPNVPPAPKSPRPHIIYFICDDLGTGDVSYYSGSKFTPTPNIDKLAWDGIILRGYYSPPVCSPSRGCHMSAKYQFQIGMQTKAIGQGEPWGLPLQFKIAPYFFKKLGYNTQQVGKWHLGQFHRDYFPNARGFDYSYGILDGDANFFNYTSGWVTPVPTEGRTLRENGRNVPYNHTNNFYLPDLLNAKAEQIIRNHDTTIPLYMYFATPLIHTAGEPSGAVIHTMPEYQLRPAVFAFSDQFPERKKSLATIQALDESFRRVTQAVVNKGMADNTIIVFVSDNGGGIPQGGFFIRGANYASNYPLRFGKGTMFEGGTRTPAFIWSPLLKKRGWISNALFHTTDFLPTLYEAAGGNVEDLKAEIPDMAGMSHWQGLQAGLAQGPRKEVPINIDQLQHSSALVYEDNYGTRYKLIQGNVFDNSFGADIWYLPEGAVPGDDSWRVWTPARVMCNFPEGKEVTPCKPWEKACLFDVTNDPCETNNIADSYPSMVTFLKDRIEFWNATSIPAGIQGFDPLSNPDRWETLWVPWRDPQPWDVDPIIEFTAFNPSSSF